ncbi:MAG: methylated-DNA--[protein]-cysteine S-methyltransferase [Pseudomonadota bacterium]
MATTVLKTAVGPLAVTEADDAIIRVTWSSAEEGEETSLLREAKRQLTAYFDGDLTVFDLPLAPTGNDFQKTVCDAMLAIPFGETRTYGDIARDLGTYGQPVGQACGANSIPVIIPCHRVLSATGLGGYSGSGGIETKIALLRHEDAYPFLV